MPVTPVAIAIDLGEDLPSPGTTIWDQRQMWIDDAQLLIEDRRVRVGAALEAAKIDYVVRKAVVAHARKPDDATQITISVDDGSTARRYESSRGRVEVIDEWWDFLGLAFINDGAAFTIRPAGRIDTPEALPW